MAQPTGHSTDAVHEAWRRTFGRSAPEDGASFDEPAAIPCGCSFWSSIWNDCVAGRCRWINFMGGSGPQGSQGFWIA